MRMSSAYESAIIVARQNGKGAILEALELAWLFLLGARTVVHSAHEFATSREHFQRVHALIENTPEMKAELARGGIKWSHGDESINLANGQRLLFKTRTKGAARGFSPDKIVMDEAMFLKNDAVAAMKYASSARPDAQIVYTGSAGDRESEHFGRARSRGIKGSDPRLFLAEWSADGHSLMCPASCTDHDDASDPEVWAKANPGLGIRIREDTVRSEYLGDPRAVFERERLSIGDWPTDDEAWTIIPQEAWANCFDPLSGIVGPATFAIDTTPDKKSSCISACGANGEGFIHGEVTSRDGLSDHRPGTSWVVRRAISLHKRHRNSVFVINQASFAGTYIDELQKAGVKVLLPTLREYAQACGELFSSVVPIGGSTPHFRHLDQPELNQAVAGAEKKDSQEMWVWDKKTSATDISPLVSLTLAMWGHNKRVNKPKPKPQVFWG